MIQLLKYGNTNCYYIKGKNGNKEIYEIDIKESSYDVKKNR